MVREYPDCCMGFFHPVQDLFHAADQSADLVFAKVYFLQQKEDRLPVALNFT